MPGRLAKVTRLLAFGIVLPLPAFSQTYQVPPAAQQIAAAVLPLPEVMRKQAAVLGYAPDMSFTTLRPGSNGMVCMTSPPGSDQFDVRCYHECFMPVVRRLRELTESNASQEEIYRLIDADLKSKKLSIPDHPTAGYRMLGPISAYDPRTNTVSKEVESWQSVHFPYKTADEIGLPEEGQVPRTMPYVMSSGTFWSHVMIEH
jgi:hypothetical protein